jgi:dTDP-L-rhamnose 4-epimerase
VAAGEVDLMLASRVPDRGAWPLHARLANRVLMAEVRRRTTLALTDLGPLRAGRRHALLELGLADRRSGWPLEMVLVAHRAGWRIDETPAPYRPRTGRSKVTGTVRGTVQAIADMAAILRR